MLSIASEVGNDHSEIFNADQFKIDWKSGAGREPFRKDLQQAAYHKIGRFPTLTFTNNLGKGIMIVGYRPYDELVKALQQISIAQPATVME